VNRHKESETLVQKVVIIWQKKSEEKRFLPLSKENLSDRRELAEFSLFGIPNNFCLAIGSKMINWIREEKGGQSKDRRLAIINTDSERFPTFFIIWRKSNCLKRSKIFTLSVIVVLTSLYHWSLLSWKQLNPIYD